MSNSTWSGQRARVFARGLYHVAACDGMQRHERAALQTFLDKVGVPETLDSLAAEPFDYGEAADLLDSTWLRRTFVQACRIMVQMDGKITPTERDTLRGMAVALGIGENVALDDIAGPRPAPDALVEWVNGLAVDFVSWDDADKRAWFWFFPHPDHPLAAGAEIRVCHGQVLMVRDEGEVTDVIEAGNHEAGPALMPGLTARRGEWPAGGVEADLLFVRTGPSPILRWGTTFPAEVPTRRWGVVPLRAFGRFSVRIEDPPGVAMRFARTRVPTDDEVDGRLRRMIAGRFAEALTQLDFPDDRALIDGLNDLDGLTDRVLPALKAGLNRSGIKLIRFLVENLTGPLELGLKPRSRRTDQLTALGRTLLGGAGPTPTAAVPLVTRAVPRARPATAGDAIIDTHDDIEAIADGTDGIKNGTNGIKRGIENTSDGMANDMPDGVAATPAPRPVPVPAAATAARPPVRSAPPPIPAVTPVPARAVRALPPQVTAHALPELAQQPCIACGVAIPVGSRFCMQCGTPQTRPCIACGADLPGGARFCSHCGTRQT